MESRFVPGPAVASFDVEIVKGLKISTVSRWSRPPSMQIGLRNESGEVYRTIGIDDMNDWIDSLQWFLDHGFIDEIGPHGDTWRGCDALFRRPARDSVVDSAIASTHQHGLAP
jgi:hypothetical protein